MTETPDRDPLDHDVDETTPTPDDAPDAITDPDVDEVRADDPRDSTDATGSETDPYELRSMPTDPNPTDDDPGGFVGTP